MAEYKMTAPCLFGVEGILSNELKRLEAKNVSAENGRVCFTGDEYMLARANICSRFAERILIDLAEFNAETFTELFDGVRAIPFENYIGMRDSFPVKGWSINSALHSVPDCQSIIKKAIVERLKTVYRTDWFEESGPQVAIRFSIMKNKVSIMIDTSGAGLHKRGYRARSNDAPIKETLAAAMCDCARIFPDTQLVDPFCGSGTILIEAALMAKKQAPGLRKFFAAEKFGFLKPEHWSRERERAVGAILNNIEFHAVGYDNDPAAVELTKQNAKKAGVEKYITAEVRDIKDFAVPDGYAKIITNPPYGERLLDIRGAEKLYTEMGDVFRLGGGKKYFVISPHEEFEKFFGVTADKRRKLYNGMIKCQLYMYLK